MTCADARCDEKRPADCPCMACGKQFCRRHIAGSIDASTHICFACAIERAGHIGCGGHCSH